MTEARIFRLNRHGDIVGQGLLASDGAVSIRWLTTGGPGPGRYWSVHETILEVYEALGPDVEITIEFLSEGGWRAWQPKQNWLESKTPSSSKTGSPPVSTPLKTVALAPWETLPKKIQSRARLTSKVLNDAEIVRVEEKLRTGRQDQRSQLPTDERLASLEERMTRQSTVRAVEEATDKAWKSRHYKY